MKISHIFYFSAVILILAGSCKTEKADNPLVVPVQGNEGINVVIEIPAGTNHKIEIDKVSGAFKNDQLNGMDRIINFLPYPGNYGFIPNTLMDESAGGDGDALDVLVIAESVPTGTVLQVLPIAVLMMKDGGELDSKIIAIPVEPAKQVMKAKDFQTFITEYSMAQNIIQDWFLNYKGLGKVEFQGWRDEQYALREIEKWTIESPE